MANRQYVGARYVPKFYQGSNGNEWDSGVVYEALTMVTYLGSTYCSKKPVPARTVAPNEDTEYWVLTAAYSSQVAELREVVEGIEDDIDTINDNIDNLEDTLEDDIADIEKQTNFITFYKLFHNKKVLIVGDSLSIPNTTWADTFKTNVEAVGGTVTNIAEGGFTAAQCANAVLNVSDAFDYAIIWCGINDVSHHAVITDYTPLGRMDTATTFNYQYKLIIDRLRALNASMRIYTLGIAYALAGAYVNNNNLYLYSSAIQAISTYCGCVYKDMSEIFNNSYANRKAMVSDNVHFTEAFSKTVLYEAIVEKLSSPIGEKFDKTFTMVGKLTAGSNVTLGAFMSNHELGKVVDITGLLILGANTSDGDTIFTLDFDYIPTQTWITLTGAQNKSGIGVNQGKAFKSYGQIDAGTYTFHIHFIPTYNEGIQPVNPS